MRAWIVVAIVCCAVPGLASAQGLFLQKGTSGYGADMGLSTDGGFVAFGVDAGVSYQGWLDAQLAVNGTRLDPADWDGDVVAGYGLVPGIALHPLKQSATTPVSIALGTDLGLYTFSGGPDGMSAWAIDGWATVYRFFKLASTYGVIPGVQLTYSHVTDRVDAFSASTDNVSVSLGGHVAWLLDSGYMVTATPGITLGSEPPVFSLTIGALRALP